MSFKGMQGLKPKEEITLNTLLVSQLLVLIFLSEFCRRKLFINL